MGLIESIRKKKTLIIVIIGIAMLLFILSSNLSDFFILEKEPRKAESTK